MIRSSSASPQPPLEKVSKVLSFVVIYSPVYSGQLAAINTANHVFRCMSAWR